MNRPGLYLCALMVFSTSVSAQQRFVASLTGAQEVPANGSGGRGTCSIVLNAAQTQITVNCTFSGLGSAANAAHIHGNGAVGVNAPVLLNFGTVPAATSGTIGPLDLPVTAAQVAAMRSHLLYANIHSANFPGGEIRGQIKQANTIFDNDGDGRTDVTVFRQSTNTFWVQNSLNGGVTQYVFGTGANDVWLNGSGDFDGDGRGDPLLLKLDENFIATWSIFETSTNTIRNVQFGNFGQFVQDKLTMADYDGDGKQDIAIFRSAFGQWWIQDSSTGQTRVERWGTGNDFPAVGDYDGDGKADLTVVRREFSQLVWYIRNSSNGTMRRDVFGSAATDNFFFFAHFDFDGDSKQDIEVYRDVNDQRIFHILRSSDGQYVQIPWGLSTDLAIFGDYDGDGKTDLVARRSVNGNFVWYARQSSDGALQLSVWGLPTDQRIVGSDNVRSFAQTE